MEAVNAGIDNWVIAVANAVIALMFLDLGRMMWRAARLQRREDGFDRAANQFRWAIGTVFLGLGIFLGWITLAWAAVIPYNTRVQAVLLAGVAGAAVWSRISWRWRGSDEAALANDLDRQP